MVKSIERVLEGEPLRKALNRENLWLIVDGEAKEFYFKKTVGAYVIFDQNTVLRWTAKLPLYKKVCYI